MLNFRGVFIAAALLAAPAPALAAGISAVLYKNPQCSCCEDYAKYLRKSGYNVEVKVSNDLAEISRKAGVPAELQGCHSMFVGGYVVDGHVPVTVINKLLKTRPPLAGVALAGMPTGSPGMGGPKTGPFKIYAIKKNGSAPTLYAVE